jgi:hypothetical protein
MNSLQTSKIVRAIMQAHGKQRIYNNIYPSMRSVKCYAGEGSRDAIMCDDLAKVLRTQGVNFEIKRKIVTHKGWGPFSSIIVRILNARS